VLDPATGETLGTIPAGDGRAADAAVREAVAAQPAWARTAPGERGAILRAAARRLRAGGAAEELAVLQTRENGRPLAESRASVEAGIGTIEQYAELGPLHRGRSLQGAWDATDLMVHEPRGVVALLVPWNDPVAIACGQLAACLAAGNAVVLKPSERTPLATARLVELLDLPGGVLRLLLGDARAGRPLAAHPGVDLVVHTGSVATGRELAQACAGDLRKALLELGGKDPLVVDAGVDPGWAAAQAAAGAFANAGQLCTSVERIYVHEDVADAFAEALVAEARALRLGPASTSARRWARSSTSVSGRSSTTTSRRRSPRARSCSPAARSPRATAASTRPRCCAAPPTRWRSCARRPSAPWRRSGPSAPSTRRCARPTGRRTASPRRS
jgi:succinate-semialdehyde dehydrogenase/glutarate-semialdehyde dehydrogenase